jgi:hypothetical protein
MVQAMVYIGLGRPPDPLYTRAVLLQLKYNFLFVITNNNHGALVGGILLSHWNIPLEGHGFDSHSFSHIGHFSAATWGHGFDSHHLDISTSPATFITTSLHISTIIILTHGNIFIGPTGCQKCQIE